MALVAVLIVVVSLANGPLLQKATHSEIMDTRNNISIAFLLLQQLRDGIFLDTGKLVNRHL